MFNITYYIHSGAIVVNVPSNIIEKFTPFAYQYMNTYYTYILSIILIHFFGDIF